MEQETILARGRTLTLLPGVFWHLANNHSLIFYNARLGEGLLATISLVRLVEGDDRFASPYTLRASDPKEELWDEVRRELDPSLPGRTDGSFFAFETEDQADARAADWFSSEPRHKVKVRLVAGSRFIRVDGAWLDGDAHLWRGNAGRYWRGEMSTNPKPEILVMGLLYFPDWKEPPFGMLFPHGE